MCCMDVVCSNMWPAVEVLLGILRHAVRVWPTSCSRTPRMMCCCLLLTTATLPSGGTQPSPWFRHMCLLLNTQYVALLLILSYVEWAFWVLNTHSLTILLGIGEHLLILASMWQQNNPSKHAVQDKSSVNVHIRRLNEEINMTDGVVCVME